MRDLQATIDSMGAELSEASADWLLDHTMLMDDIRERVAGLPPCLDLPAAMKMGLTDTERDIYTHLVQRVGDTHSEVIDMRSRGLDTTYVQSILKFQRETVASFVNSIPHVQRQISLVSRMEAVHDEIVAGEVVGMDMSAQREWMQEAARRLEGVRGRDDACGCCAGRRHRCVGR